MRAQLPGDESTPLLVAYSGGKDSLVTMDLCVRSGRQVQGYLLSFLPGMDYTAYWIEYAIKRWGVRVREYQDPNTIRLLRIGRFRHRPLKTIPAITIRETEAKARLDAGCEWIGYGYKAVDSIDRRVMLKTWPNGIHEGWKKFAPIAQWRHAEVLAYLSRHQIEIPVAAKAGMSGVGLKPAAQAWLRQFWPRDYERILEAFPLAQAQADRAEIIRADKERRRAERGTGAGAADSPLADSTGGL